MTTARVRRLPPDAAARARLNDELHARPVAPIRVPALVTQIAVLNQSLTVAQELAHVGRLTEAHARQLPDRDPSFVHVCLPGFAVRWERHGEFSVYAVTQPLDPSGLWGTENPDLLGMVAASPEWLAEIPGETLVALQVLLIHAPVAGSADETTAKHTHALLGPGRLLGSSVRDGCAQLFTTYRLREDGTSRFLLVCGDVSEGRAGRLVAGLAELETYRTLAMMAFPMARLLQPRLAAVESRLSAITQAIDRSSEDDPTLLHDLMQQAAQLESDTATHSTRFAAARAYDGIVRRRIDDLRGTSVPGMTGVFTFLDRRLIPAMATVEATATRLAAATERLGRAADLLRTRVDITTESQNQELLRSLGRGQRLQLTLQETVEGLSIAAISYYVIGLVGYLAKGAKAAGLPVNPDIAAGLAVPIAVAAVWWTLRRVRARMRRRHR